MSKETRKTFRRVFRATGLVIALTAAALLYNACIKDEEDDDFEDRGSDFNEVFAE